MVKKDDHAMDALRYVAMERPWLTGLERPKRKGYDGFRPDYTPPWTGQRLRQHEYGTHGSFY